MNKVRLGAFVLITTTFLILGLYYIGSNKNIFHSTITVSADFKNVQGLLPGNNVRFNGINVGTVSKVYSISDTLIRVEFTIDEASTQYIHDNSIASIGNDGLLGNKLIEIAPGKGEAPSIKANAIMKSLNPIEMESSMRTLAMTNENLKIITDNLKNVTEKINDSHSLWNLLSDSVISENVRNAVVYFEITSQNTAKVTGDLSNIVKEVKSGKGTLGSLIMDSSISDKLNQTIIQFQNVSDTIGYITGNFKQISDNIKNGQGSIGTLLTDTMFVHNLNESMENIAAGSDNFNENMEALKMSWPFKKYFKKKEKQDLKH